MADARHGDVILIDDTKEGRCMKTTIVFLILLSLTITARGLVKEDYFIFLRDNDTSALYSIHQPNHLCDLRDDSLTTDEIVELKMFMFNGETAQRMTATMLLFTLATKSYQALRDTIDQASDAVQLTAYLPYLQELNNHNTPPPPAFDTTRLTYLYTTVLFSEPTPLRAQEEIVYYSPYNIIDKQKLIPLIRHSQSSELRKLCIDLLTDIPQLDREKISLYMKQETDSIKRQMVIDTCKKIDKMIESSATMLRDFVHSDSVEIIQIKALEALIKLDTLTEKELQVARILLTSQNHSTFKSACNIVSAAKDTLALPILIKRIPKEKEMYSNRDSDALFAMFRILSLPHSLNSNDHYHVTFPKQYFKVAQCDWNSRESVLQCEYEQAIKLIEWWKREAGVDEYLTR